MSPLAVILLVSLLTVAIRGPALPFDSQLSANIYRYVYLGSISNDLGSDRVSTVESPGTPHFIQSQSEPFIVMNAVFELPLDGELPAVLAAPISFGAILRYNPKSSTDVDRVRNWITANKARCREIFVVNYPIQGESAEVVRAELETVWASIVDPEHKVEPIVVLANPDGNGPSLEDLVKFFSIHIEPHETFARP